MSSRLKNKISALVQSQVPEFVGNDFPLFVSFVEDYYKFLEQDQGAQEVIQNALEYNDIDLTIEPFIKFFINSYANRFPESLISDKRFLVKKIKDLYESKGSELSYQILFRALFNDDVTIKFPFENILRASGGRFEVRTSIRVLTTQGNRDQIVERELTYFNDGVRFDVGIVSIKKLTTSLTEVFLDPKVVIPFQVGDSITVFGASGNIVFAGIIEPTTVDFEVQVKGLNFKVGQVFTVNILGGIDTLVKVIKVDSNGGIEKLKFVNYGFNYQNEFFSDFVSTTNAGFPSLDVLIDPNTGIISTQRKSRTEGFASFGTIQHFDTKTNFVGRFEKDEYELFIADPTQGTASKGSVYLFDNSFSNANVTTGYFTNEYISFSEPVYAANILQQENFDNTIFLPPGGQQIVLDNSFVQINRVDNTLGFGSTGKILLFDNSFTNANATTSYFENEYVEFGLTPYAANLTDEREFDTSIFSGEVEIIGPTLSQFSRNVFVGSDDVSKLPEIATIRFFLGAVGRYPGAYIVNDSFISEEEVRVADGGLFQPFAYQTNTVIDISDFYDIVINLLHPAGQVLFNNRIIRFDADISANISVQAAANVFFITTDSFDPTDTQSYELFKELEDNTDSSDETSFELSKPLFDEFEIFDSTPLTFIKAEEDLVETDDELQPFTITKGLSDGQRVGDLDADPPYFAEIYTEYADPTEAYSQLNEREIIVNLTKSIEDELVNIVEFFQLNKNPYFLEDYVVQSLDASESYTELLTEFFKTPIEIEINNSVEAKEVFSSSSILPQTEVVVSNDFGTTFEYDVVDAERYFDTVYEEGGYAQTDSINF